MVNSIRDNLDKTDTISEIKLLIGSRQDIVCVLVEGKKDNKVLRFLLSKKVVLIESFGGKRGIIEILRDYYSNEKRVIGIRDCDYCDRNNDYNCFYYDFSCLEMMIVSIKSCYYRVFSFFVDSNESDADSFLFDCFNHLRIISKVRQLNEIFHWKMNLTKVNISSLCDEDTSTMNQNIINQVNRCNPDNKIDSIRLNMLKSYPDYSKRNDFLNAINGHDFIKYFNWYCRMGGNNISIKEIEDSLYCAFGPNEFKETSLYTSILEYQKENGLEIVG